VIDGLIIAVTLGKVSPIDANHSMFGANQIIALGLRAITCLSGRSGALYAVL
jgi:hypothetical protein